jgi:Na+/H+-translocating membrane pyrophosphatase
MWALILGVIGFVIAIVIYNIVKAQSVGNERTHEILDDIHTGMNRTKVIKPKPQEFVLELTPSSPLSL